MTTDHKSSRQRFETWADEEAFIIEHMKALPNRYEDRETQQCWDAWLESRKALFESISTGELLLAISEVHSGTSREGLEIINIIIEKLKERAK